MLNLVKGLIKEEQYMFKDVVKAWSYLENHSMFAEHIKGTDLSVSHFSQCLDIQPVKVNPVTHEISDNAEDNTKVEIWLEAGPWVSHSDTTHDDELDCGADTFENAIILLAESVKAVYSDDVSSIEKRIKDIYWVEGTDFCR